MKKTILILAVAVAITSSCKKGPGEGGTSTITGKIHAKYYDKKIQTVQAEEYAPKEDVFIIYGDEITYGNNQKTSYEGVYEFKYLRKGMYKVYAYSRDSADAYINQVNQLAPNVAVVAEVEITSNKQTVEVPDINIIK